jgi:hypothetical protein
MSWHEKSSQQGLWRMASFGMLRRVALVRTDVLEELSASFIRVTRIGVLGTMLTVTSKRCMLQRNTKYWHSSETSVLTRATRRNIPEDAILHSHRRENLKTYKVFGHRNIWGMLIRWCTRYKPWLSGPRWPMLLLYRGLGSHSKQSRHASAIMELNDCSSCRFGPQWTPPHAYAVEGLQQNMNEYFMKSYDCHWGHALA